MDQRSVSARGNIDRSIVVTGDGNTASIHFGSDFTLPLARRQIRPVRRRPLSADNPLPLLAADAGAFPLVGRERMIAELRAWLDSAADVSIHALIARAGTGKTRLAIELCKLVDGGRQPGESGWSAGFLRPSDLANVVDQLATRHYDQARPTLLVVDYAAAVHRELARWLDRLAGAPFEGKLRILLLDREAPEGFGWWQDLTRPTDSSNRADLFLDPERPQRLPDLDQDENRRRLFEAAFDATSTLMGDNAPGHILPAAGDMPSFDAAIADPRFGNPLNLAMAGLIAAEKGPHEAVALRRLEAARHLARRERDRMVRLGESHGVVRSAMCHALGFNGLAGGLPVGTLIPDLTAELSAASLGGDVTALAELLEQELPHEGCEVDDGAEPRLGTIQPDLLGEAVIIETLLVGPTSHTAAAPAILRRAYARTGGRCAEALMRLIQDYGYPLEDPQASEAEKAVAGPVLTLASSLADAIPNRDVHELEAFVSAIPQRTTILRELAAAQTIRLAQRWREIADTLDSSQSDLVKAAKGRAAGWLINVGNRLTSLGQTEGALAAALESTEIFRELYDSNYPEFAPDLAMSLSNLCGIFSESGDRLDALAAAREAVEIRRALASDNAEFLPGLGFSLNNLALILSELDDSAAAIAPASEAADIYRRLAAEHPEKFSSGLALVLNNLGNHLNAAGNYESAYAVTQEAVDLRRALAAARPDAFTPELASSLHNLAMRLAAVNRAEPALQAAREAVELRRRLTAAFPDAFTAELAMSLSVLADRLEQVGRPQEALLADIEAIKVLAPYFFLRPHALYRRMGALFYDYARRAEATGQPIDQELAGPIMEMMTRMIQRAE